MFRQVSDSVRDVADSVRRLSLRMEEFGGSVRRVTRETVEGRRLLDALHEYIDEELALRVKETELLLTVADPRILVIQEGSRYKIDAKNRPDATGWDFLFEVGRRCRERPAFEKEEVVAIVDELLEEWGIDDRLFLGTGEVVATL